MKNEATMEATQTPQSVLDALADAETLWSIGAAGEQGVALVNAAQCPTALAWPDPEGAAKAASLFAHEAFRAVPALREE